MEKREPREKLEENEEEGCVRIKGGWICLLGIWMAKIA
jgi:hypothetical protein